MKKLGLILGILMVAISASISVLAIGNPNTLAFGSGSSSQYNVFNNVLETGDWLIDAEGLVAYTVTPTDYTASEAFLFELLNTAGNVTYASTPLKAYGDRPISIYLTKAQADALGLTIGSAYGIRITGNPNVFASTTNNTITTFLNAGDYIDQSASGNTTTTNLLRNAMIIIAQNMQAYDGVTTYLTTIQGIQYLTTTGGDLFQAGIPNLSTMCPVLFQSGLQVLQNEVPNATGAYASTISITNQWGATTANGLTALGLYMGISQALAGTVVYFILMLAFGVFFLYPRLQNTTSLVLFMAVTPFIGSFMGFIALPIAFDAVLFVMIIVGYYFVSRGTL